MKKAFDTAGIKHLPWILLSTARIEDGKLTDGTTTLDFPVVLKHFYGSRGEGNYKIDTPEQYINTIKGKTPENYLIEPFYSGTVEFRIHITSFGPIYCLRKMLREDTPKENRWYRNDSNCVWITEFKQVKHGDNFIRFSHEAHPDFNKPNNWNEILEEAIKALKSVGGDILAVDVKAQSNIDSKDRKREKVEFYILEVNSAPAMGAITAQIYKEQLPNILQAKYGCFR